MTLELIQPLTEMSTRSISWVVKAAGAYLLVPIVMQSGRLNLLEPTEPVQAYIEVPLPLPLPD
jgi:hypothetical protein